MDANTFATFVIAGFVIFFVVYDHVVRLVKKFIMSSVEAENDGTDEPVPDVVPVPVPGTNRIDIQYLAENLTYDQLLEVLALAKNARGAWLFTGKKLFTLFGGNYPEFLAKMRKLRGDGPDDPPEEPTVLTPIAGRPTKASYYETDPDLAYQPPPR